MNAAAIVFGANGQVGQNLISLATKRGLDFRAITRSDADITDAKAVKNVFERCAPRLAINCAAYTAVDRAEQHVELANAVNADGAGIVATTCATLNIPLIHLSTDYVFDGKKKKPYHEFDPTSPINIYGQSKLKGEMQIQMRLRNYVILRTSWVYGPYGNNFLKTILLLAREKPELRIVSDQHGCPTSTMDLAEAILTAARKLASHEDCAGIYHFAGTGRTNWCEFASKILKRASDFAGPAPRIIPISTDEYPTAAKRPMNSELDSARFSRLFGYSAKPWRERVAETVDILHSPNHSALP